MVKGKERRIRFFPKDSDFLHKSCEKVIEFDDNLAQEIADMKVTLSKNGDGVGLSANQIGILKQILITKVTYDMIDQDDSSTATPEYKTYIEDCVFINPKIVEVNSSYSYSYNEGCLSVPGYYEKTTRPYEIVVEYQDENGEIYKVRFSGFLAFVIQHEIDHLNGVLFIDGKSRLKMKNIQNKINKYLKRFS